MHRRNWCALATAALVLTGTEAPRLRAQPPPPPAVRRLTLDEAAAQAQLDKGTRDLLSGVAQAYHALLGTLRIQAALELQVQLLEQVGGANPPAELRIGLLETRQGLAQARGQALELAQQLNS